MTNATQEPKTRSAGAVRVDRLRPNAWNKARPLDEAFVTSIRARGILSPILVRPVEEDGEGRDLEIICGERRWRAAVELGLEYLPAVIHAATDEDAQTDTLIENTHRTGLTPWQEAQLIGDLLEKPGMDVEAVSAATGWSEATVRRRAKLLDLSPSWRTAMDKGILPLWTISHYETLAIYDEKQQEALWDRMEYDEGIRGASVTDLRREISRDTRVLKHAPWDLTDPGLCPAAGSCAECPKRTGANADLFAEVDPKVKDSDRCLDEGCFGEKSKAWVARKEAEAREKHGDQLVKLDKDYTGAGGALHEHQIERVKKNDKGAVPALVVSGKGLGGIEWVRPKQGQTASAGNGGRKKTADQRKEDYERRRAIRAIEKLIAIIEDEGKELVFEKGALAVCTQYALAFGVEVDRHNMVQSQDKRVRAFASKPYTLEEIWDSVESHLVHDLEQLKRVQNHESGETLLQNAALAAWMVDADLKALKAQADEEIPLPVSLGGTGKTKTSQDQGGTEEDSGEGWDNIEVPEANYHGMPED